MTRPILTLTLACSLAFTAAASAQAPPAGELGNTDIHMFTSADARHFTENRVLVEHAAMPSLVRTTDGALIAAFQWFSSEIPGAFDRIATVTSDSDGRNWTLPRPVDFIGLPVDYLPPSNPCLVTLGDGRVRMYYISGAPGKTHPAIYSAISDEGVRYGFEPGPRFAVEGMPLTDCAVARWGNTCHLYAPIEDRPGMAFHAVSSNGLQFVREDDVRLDSTKIWKGSVVRTRDGLAFYGSGGWRAVSTDGRNWALLDMDGVNGDDSTICRARNDRYVLLTSLPRREAVPAAVREIPPLVRVESTPSPLVRVTPGDQNVTANDQFVYILRGDSLFQFDARTLRLVAETRLPVPAQTGYTEPERTVIVPEDAP